MCEQTAYFRHSSSLVVPSLTKTQVVNFPDTNHYQYANNLLHSSSLSKFE